LYKNNRTTGQSRRPVASDLFKSHYIDKVKLVRPVVGEHGHVLVFASLERIVRSGYNSTDVFARILFAIAVSKDINTFITVTVIGECIEV
jgi:hypothetical protein